MNMVHTNGESNKGPESSQNNLTLLPWYSFELVMCD